MYACVMSICVCLQVSEEDSSEDEDDFRRPGEAEKSSVGDSLINEGLAAFRSRRAKKHEKHGKGKKGDSADAAGGASEFGDSEGDSDADAEQKGESVYQGGAAAQGRRNASMEVDSDSAQGEEAKEELQGPLAGDMTTDNERELDYGKQRRREEETVPTPFGCVLCPKKRLISQEDVDLHVKSAQHKKRERKYKKMVRYHERSEEDIAALRERNRIKNAKRNARKEAAKAEAKASDTSMSAPQQKQNPSSSSSFSSSSTKKKGGKSASSSPSSTAMQVDNDGDTAAKPSASPSSSSSKRKKNSKKRVHQSEDATPAQESAPAAKPKAKKRKKN
jgi:hypothetical protein